MGGRGEAPQPIFRVGFVHYALARWAMACGTKKRPLLSYLVEGSWVAMDHSRRSQKDLVAVHDAEPNPDWVEVQAKRCQGVKGWKKEKEKEDQKEKDKEKEKGKDKARSKRSRGAEGGYGTDDSLAPSVAPSSQSSAASTTRRRARAAARPPPPPGPAHDSSTTAALLAQVQELQGRLDGAQRELQNALEFQSNWEVQTAIGRLCAREIAPTPGYMGNCTENSGTSFFGHKRGERGGGMHLQYITAKQGDPHNPHPLATRSADNKGAAGSMPGAVRPPGGRGGGGEAGEGDAAGAVRRGGDLLPPPGHEGVLHHVGLDQQQVCAPWPPTTNPQRGAAVRPPAPRPPPPSR